MAAADAAAPLTFTDVQREAAAKQRAYEAGTAGPSGRGADTAGTPCPRLLFRAAAWSSARTGHTAGADKTAQGSAAPRCAVGVAVVDNSIPVSVLRSLAGVHERDNCAAHLSGTLVKMSGRLGLCRTRRHLAQRVTQSAHKGYLTGGPQRADGSRRAFYRDFVKVVEAADVVIEVLDARDPLSCRCVDVERFIRRAGASKKIILLLNKIGASASVPRSTPPAEPWSIPLPVFLWSVFCFKRMHGCSMHRQAACGDGDMSTACDLGYVKAIKLLSVLRRPGAAGGGGGVADLPARGAAHSGLQVLHAEAGAFAALEPDCGFCTLRRPLRAIVSSYAPWQPVRRHHHLSSSGDACDGRRVHKADLDLPDLDLVAALHQCWTCC